MSIACVSGEPAGKIRLQSGTYFSPLFAPEERPVRVAIPYSAPYISGHGTLVAFVVVGAAVVALTPAWHVQASSGEHRHDVIRQPRESCENSRG